MDVFGSSLTTGVPASKGWAVPYVPYMARSQYSLDLYNPSNSRAFARIDLSGPTASGNDVQIPPHLIAVPAGGRRVVDVTNILAPYRSGPYGTSGAPSDPIEASAIIASSAPIVVGQRAYWDVTVDGVAIHGGDHSSALRAGDIQLTNTGTDLSIRYAKRANAFKGEADADSPCHRNRRVIVKKVQEGKDETVGRTNTSDQGRWKLPVNKAKGRYYAKTKAKTPSAHVVCLGDRSKTIRVG